MFNIKSYQKVLSKDFPEFLNKYLSLPILTRLKDIGLLCGTDWTPVFHNHFYYSRFDHSVGVALVIWHFTHNKAQTIAGLLHDVSTPAFSHVSDFRKGDALTQTKTESSNESIILEDAELRNLLTLDSLTAKDVCNYHDYPIADNEVPRLSADRLEYMFPSGAALEKTWSLKEIKREYEDIVILKNEDNLEELGFRTKSIALEYCQKFIEVGLILQTNRDKVIMQLLGEILNLALKLKIIFENDLFEYSEKVLLKRFESFIKQMDSNNLEHVRFSKLYKAFRKGKEVIGSEEPLENYFCVNLNVKKRYIDPLVLDGEKAVRLSAVSDEANKAVQNFLRYEDKKYGCIKLV